jgi:hypothetical protein
MSGTNNIKNRKTQTLTQIVSEKVGLDPSHVAKVLKGTRNNEVVTQQYNRLEQLVDQFKKEPIQN